MLLLAIGFVAKGASGEDVIAATARGGVNAKTLQHKVMCGYQGWFRCPGDGTQDGWLHWSRNSQKISPETVTVEMWPDLSEFSADEKYPARGFSYPNGEPAHLFSAAHPQTVERHFRWMEQYGIDGAFVQRFLVNSNRPSFDKVLDHVRTSAAKTGRAYAICYDLTGTRKEKLYEQLVADWKRLVDEQKVTQDERYLHHNGKPVLMVWGFFDDRFDAELGHRIVDFFKNDERYAVTLVGGCQWYWRKTKDTEWAKVFRRFDIISPWNVGNFTEVAGERQASTGYWRDDMVEAKKSGMAYLPVVYPGFGWTNLQGKAAERNTLPRLRGEFYWRQFFSASELGMDMVYVAMFDEVDEATAIFKVSSTPPTQAKFTTLDGLPTDFYLRLTGEGAKLIRGEKKGTMKLPIIP